jgi:D-alanyl-D-alanine carboxypeptidase
MAFTGVLGQTVLGQFVLGAVGSDGNDLEPSISSVLSLTQTAEVHGTIGKAASNTLSLTQSVALPEPLTPVVGFSGSQTRYVYVKDITNSQVLYKLNEISANQYPASCCKLMTALVIMQWKSGNLSDTVTVQAGDLSYPVSTDVAGLGVGDVITFEGLLYGIFLPSGADCCQAAGRVVGDLIYVANGSTGNSGLTRFIEEMNLQATALGLTDTFFETAFGYSRTGGTNHSRMTAQDLNVLTRAALNYSAIRTIAGTPSRSQPVTGSNPRNISMTNYNRFINGPSLNQQGIKDANVIGGKNGTWNDSGGHYNLSQIWTAPNGHEIVITVMNAESLYALHLDMQGLIYALVRDWPYLADGVDIGGDPQYGNVKLLIGADGSIVDETVNARALTNNSVTVDDPVIESTGGMGFSAQGDYLRVTNDDSDLQIGSGDGTVEVWWSALAGGVTTMTGEDIFFAKAQHTPSVKREWLVNRFNNVLQLFVSFDGTNWSSAIAFSLGTDDLKVFFNGAPRHFALVKNGTTWNLYVNGEKGGASLTGNLTDSDAFVAVGYYASAVSGQGIYDDFRMSVGYSRYTDYKHTLSGRMFPREVASEQPASNSLSLTQTVEIHGTLNRSCTSTLALTHTRTAVNVFNRSATNTETFTDRAQRCYEADADNTITFTQSVVDSRGANNSLALSHSVELHLVVGRNLPQNLNVTQTTTRNIVVSKAAANTLALTQVLKRVVPKSASNTITFSETLSGFAAKPAVNTLNLGSVVAVVHANGRHASNTLALTQSVSCAKVFARTAASTVVFTESEHLVHERSVSETLTFVQNVNFVLSKRASNDLTLTQDVDEEHYKLRKLFANPVFTQDVVDDWVFERSVSNDITFTHNVVRLVEEDVTDTLTLTHSVDFTVAKNVISTLALTQSVVGLRVYGRSVTQNLALTQGTVGLSRVVTKRMLSILQLTHRGRIIPIHNRSVTDTFTPTQELHKEVFAEATNNFVTLSQDVQVLRVRNFNIVHVLGLTDVMGRNITKSFDITDTLTFPLERTREIRIGNLTQVTIPNIVFSVSPRPQDQQTYVTTTPTQRRQRQVMTISVPGRTVVLPVPMFGDGEGNTDVFTMSYALDATIYTTVKKSGTRSFNFEWDLALSKAEELKEFVWDHNSKAMQINTWDGEIWIARMTTNPVSFADQLRPDPNESNSHIQVALEFEGVRIH